jgi:glucose-6-phosphate isomerase
MKNINPISTRAWQKLSTLAVENKELLIKNLFEDSFRFNDYSIQLEDILVDYSKNRVDKETMATLIQLAEEIDLKSAIEAMFTGEKINGTEGRAVLHTALRNRSNTPVYMDGQDVMPDVNAVLNQMKAFADQINQGTWLGYTVNLSNHW